MYYLYSAKYLISIRLVFYDVDIEISIFFKAKMKIEVKEQGGKRIYLNKRILVKKNA